MAQKLIPVLKYYRNSYISQLSCICLFNEHRTSQLNEEQSFLYRVPVGGRPVVADARKLCRDAEIWHAPMAPTVCRKMNSAGLASLDAQKLLPWRQAD